jgi:hypothetical protein
MFAYNEVYFPGLADVGDLMMAPPFLRAMEEGPFAGLPASAPESYRLLVMASFRPVSLIHIRGIEGPSCSRTAKTWLGHPLKAMGRLDVNTVRQLRSEEQRTLRRHLYDSAFWKLDTESPRSGLDGATWVFEGFRGGRHHVVARWSPSEDGPDRKFRDLCAYMTTLADLDTRDSDE